MEYWEVTLNRCQETLPVWLAHMPGVKIGTKGTTELEALIDGFEPLVQARTLAQDNYDAAFRNVQGALAVMRCLGTKVPKLIEGHLNENVSIMKDVDDLYRNNPRTEATILKRLRELLPVWERANAALAAMSPPQPAIARMVGGDSYPVVAAKALLDGFTDLVKVMKDKEEVLDGKRSDLRAHDHAADRLNKDWYLVAKNTADPGTPLALALEGITTEPGTPAPETIEISTVVQGGEGGLQALVSFVPGGGEHATGKWVYSKREGVDAEFTKVELDFSGNALGPYEVGDVVKIYTETENSTGTRTTAVRTITITEPIF